MGVTGGVGVGTGVGAGVTAGEGDGDGDGRVVRLGVVGGVGAADGSRVVTTGGGVVADTGAGRGAGVDVDVDVELWQPIAMKVIRTMSSATTGRNLCAISVYL